MALTNIFREPRREITESAVGMGLFVAIIAGDYGFGLWVQSLGGTDSRGGHFIPWQIGMLIGVVVAAASVGVLFLTHEIGEGICNALERSGVHLRPRERRVTR